MTFGSSGTGKGKEREIPIPRIREREGNGKRAFPKFGNPKGLKKSIPTFQEQESEAIIPGNALCGFLCPLKVKKLRCSPAKILNYTSASQP